MEFLHGIKLLATATAGVLVAPKRLQREFTLLTGGDCANYYTFLGDDVLEDQNTQFEDNAKPLWLNMGYWEKATRYADACAALALRLAELGQVGPGDRIVDCGFGYAEQDILWARTYQPERIIGLNVTRLHVETARKRIESMGLADRVDLREGSATAIPLDDNSVDKVLALESAFHFDTREDFFKEAMRVLRPGGILATADMLPQPGTKPAGLVHFLGLRRWGYPRVNAYDRNVYRAKLEQHGFVDVKVDPIRQWVYPGVNRYADARMTGQGINDIRVELSPEDTASCYGVERWRANTGIDDYVLFAARKPGAAKSS